MADVLIPQNHTEKLPRMCAEPNHIASPRSHELLTEKVVRRCIRVLLQEEGFVHERIFDTIDPSEGRQGEVGKLVEAVADKVKTILNDPHHPKPPSLRDITHDQWNIHIGNVHSEYVRVAQIIFKDTVVTWGRVVALIGFSANYCLYAIEQGVMETIVESVCGWAVSFMERELSDWFQQNSWVSGFDLKECIDTIFCVLSLSAIFCG